MVVPLYDDNPFTPPVKPVVTWGLIALNLAILLYEVGASQLALDRIIDSFSLMPAAFIGDTGARGWVPAFLTIITYQFFHADITHVVGNMIFLWVFGDDIERVLGRGRYLAFYLLCGVIGGLVFVANDPHSTIELIGASGAVAGVVVGYVMLRPCAKITVLLGVIPLRISAYWVVGLFVVSQLWNLGASSKSEVAYWCHFGGMLGGAVLFPLLKPRAVRLFQCLQPVPDTVVQIGPQRAGPAARVNDLR
ncbi:MAG TPA: rhomboid family intramembrane serine protease [Xanthobacteraceae bacterium]|jgi:membrane associated rhomboid family serine protease|nr:rhomboid family intramembrane serine protease [Xanthobacteraceae bacterium]